MVETARDNLGCVKSIRILQLSTWKEAEDPPEFDPIVMLSSAEGVFSNHPEGVAGYHMAMPAEVKQLHLESSWRNARRRDGKRLRV